MLKEILKSKVSEFSVLIPQLLKTHKLLLLIFVLAFFFRGYQAVERFDFSHDGDLYSFIVKDIVVDGHFRLIGQQTSTTGIFIGPFFYYLLIPFFLLTSLDPVGVIFFAILLGLLTTYSFYYVFSKLFDKTTGLIASFLQAILLPRVTVDRWVVPTITSSLWEIWYFYALFQLSRGNFFILPLLGLLVGFIWHINLSLAPLLILIPITLFLAKKLPSLVDFIKLILGILLPLVPLVIFEVKHNFIQTTSLLNSFTTDQMGGVGFNKFNHVIRQISGNIINLFFYPERYFLLPETIVFVLVLILGIVCLLKNGVTKKYLIILYVWIFSVIIFFSVSSKIISEYYFSSLNTAVLAIFILVISFIFQTKPIFKILMSLFLIYLLIRNIMYFVFYNHYNFLGYTERKSVVSYIYQDAEKKKFPCVSVSYITTPGNDMGFRYLFYLHNLHVNQPISGSPNYTIVIEEKMSDYELDAVFGAIGVIAPKGAVDYNEVKHSCSGQNSNLTDPLFGYVE